MTAEDSPPYYDPEGVMEEHSYYFDELTKAMAQGTITRGRMLKLARALLLGRGC